MGWNRDDAKLERVRALMAEREIDALVVRAPDNVLYLTNFWGMKGYDACVFPRDGEPVLICLESSAEDAAGSAWTNDVRFLRGYDERDPRPPLARTLDLAVDAAKGHGRDAVAATPLLSEARALKTPQELERVGIANDIAADAMEYVRTRLETGMKES